MPVSQAFAQERTSRYNLDQVAHIGGIRLVGGSYSTEELCKSHRFNVTVDQSGEEHWTQDPFDRFAFMTRQAHGHNVITIAELKKILKITTAVAKLFAMGMFPVGKVNQSENKWAQDVIALDDKMSRDMSADWRSGEGEAFFDQTNKKDAAFLRSIGGHGVLEEWRKEDAEIRKAGKKPQKRKPPFLLLMFNKTASDALLMYITAVKGIMMSYDDQYFDPVVYKASISRQWDGASGLTRATAVNDAVRWMEMFNEHRKVLRLHSIVWDPQHRHFLEPVSTPTGVIYHPDTVPTLHSNSLGKLTKLSNRQEDRTGVTEQDLRQRYGLEDW